MNRSPYPFRDFLRVKDSLVSAIVEDGETYAMLTGDTGTGKTALMRTLRGEMDRARHRILYFSAANKLGAAGLVKVTGEALRVRTSMCHSVSLDRLLRAIEEESRTILLWIDEAQGLPTETLTEIRALAESDLDGACRVQILLAGLPKLRVTLHEQPHLWRRIIVREEIIGLDLDEMPAFLTHHFDQAQCSRLCEQGLAALFERAAGAPGRILPMCRSVFRRAGAGKTKIEPEQVEDSLERWEIA